jgi:hypothetical protein
MKTLLAVAVAITALIAVPSFAQESDAGAECAPRTLFQLFGLERASECASADAALGLSVAAGAAAHHPGSKLGQNRAELERSNDGRSFGQDRAEEARSGSGGAFGQGQSEQAQAGEDANGGRERAEAARGDRQD